MQLNAPRLGPRVNACADVLRSTVTANDPRLASPRSDLLQGSNYPLRRQREVVLNTQRPSVVVVNYVEQTNAAVVLMPIVLKVYGQHHVDRYWYVKA